MKISGERVDEHEKEKRWRATKTSALKTGYRANLTEKRKGIVCRGSHPTEKMSCMDADESCVSLQVFKVLRGLRAHPKCSSICAETSILARARLDLCSFQRTPLRVTLQVIKTNLLKRSPADKHQWNQLWIASAWIESRESFFKRSKEPLTYVWTWLGKIDGKKFNYGLSALESVFSSLVGPIIVSIRMRDRMFSGEFLLRVVIER